MSEEEITALAREYGVDSVDPYGFSKNTYEDFVGEYADAAADVLRWLSKRFYLIEKCKVETELKTCFSLRDGNTAPNIESAIEHHKGIEGIRLLESLFPEIAKEVEG